MQLAPIAISTYSRINHLKRTIEALQKNTLAIESELYIFSDAPQKGDEKIVAEVREYLYTIQGFKKIHIVERLVNSRVANNRGAMEELLNKYGRMIFMEDDIVTAPGFLTFMNEALEYYKNNKEVFSISGFMVPTAFPSHYKKGYLLSKYFNGWGMATWGDRGVLDIMHRNNFYEEVIKDKLIFKQLKKYHPSLIHGLKDIYKGKLDAGDYKLTYHTIINKLYQIRPTKSFVENIGHDGSGMHCGVSNRFVNFDLNDARVNFDDGMDYNFEVDKLFYNYFHPKHSLLSRIKRKLKSIIND